jgi:3-hydroxybutyryl-CoA dehydrogenase
MSNERAAVGGGGTMGAGIAHVLVESGFDVVVFDRDDDLAGSAADAVRISLRSAAERAGVQNRAYVASAVSGRAWGGEDLAGFAVLIEAVPENPELKRAVLKEAAESLGAGALLATNTSSLSITNLAEELPDPARLVGMHFFNPVPRSQLIEVVRGAATGSTVLTEAHRLAKRLGLESIEVRDSPGFASSRLGLALGLEAIRMAGEEVATPADIDQAMMLGYRHPIGPLRLTDLIGLDVRLDIARHLERELGPRFTPPPLLISMVEDGRLGRKSGHGFYEWTR